MDAENVHRFLAVDTTYANSSFPWYLVYTYIACERAETRRPRADDDHADGIFGSAMLESPLTVIHVRQKRVYMPRETVVAISLDEITWRTLLARYSILPSFLDLLHSNDGGTLAYTTFRSESSGQDQNAITQHQPIIDAMHMGYKMGKWNNDESAIYVRYDFTTGRSLVLVLGSDACLGVDAVQRLLVSTPQASIFHVVHVLHKVLYDITENVRWDVDYATLELESLTGIAAQQTYSRAPLKVEELRFNRRLQVTADWARNLA